MSSTGSKALRIVGHVDGIGEDGVVGGWCWTPDAPGRRLAVEIFDGDEVLGAVVCARQRDDLAAAKIGDGRHAFTFALPAAPAGGAKRAITVRERSSGRGLARFVLEPPPDDAPLDGIAAALGELHRAIDGLSPPGPPVGHRAAEALAGLGRRLSARGRPPDWPLPGLPARAARTSPERPFLARRPPSPPRLAIAIIAAPNVDATLAAIAAVGPEAARLGAEILVLDDGRDPRTVLLPSARRDLRYLREDGAGFADLANLAVSAARADVLGFIRSAGARDDPADGLSAAMAALEGADLVLAGRAAAAAAAAGDRELGLPAADGRAGRTPARPLAAGNVAPAGLLLVVRRTLVIAAGGFDPRMDDDLACIDLALRAALLDARLASLPAPRRQATASRSPRSATD